MAKAKAPARLEDPFFVGNARVLNPWVRWSRCGDDQTWLNAKLSLMNCHLLLEAFEVRRVGLEPEWKLVSEQPNVVQAFAKWDIACGGSQRKDAAVIAGRRYFVFAGPLP